MSYNMVYYYGRLFLYYISPSILRLSDIDEFN